MFIALFCVWMLYAVSFARKQQFSSIHHERMDRFDYSAGIGSQKAFAIVNAKQVWDTMESSAVRTVPQSALCRMGSDDWLAADRELCGTVCRARQRSMDALSAMSTLCTIDDGQDGRCLCDLAFF